MLESLFRTLCKIGTLLKISSSKKNSPNTKNDAKAEIGQAAATSGANSPIHIGDIIHNNSPKPEIDPESRFKSRLIAVAHELPHNFRYVGNVKNPFITKALEKLVHEEPLIHQHPKLLQKAQKCLSTALILSSSSIPKLKPSDGQFLMKDLAQCLSDEYGIKVPKSD